MRIRPEIRRVALRAVPWSALLHVVASLLLLVALRALPGGTAEAGEGLGESVGRSVAAGLSAALVSVLGITVGAWLASVTRAGEQGAALWIGSAAVGPLAVALLVVAALGATTGGILLGGLAVLAAVGALLVLVLRRRRRGAVVS